MSKHLWFAAKTYGWGWVPITWQGWACVAGFFTVELLAGFIFMQEAYLPWGPFAFMGSTLFAALVLIWISYKTGEPPRWRWGKD